MEIVKSYTIQRNKEMTYTESVKELDLITKDASQRSQ